MELYGYELPFEELLPRIRAEHPGLAAIGLQFPDGLRDHATAIAEIVERETGALPVISADPCYGACDLCDDEMAKLGVSVLLHIGHTEMPSVPTQHGVHVYFVPAHSSHDISDVVRRACRELPKGTRTVGLTTTAQHTHKLHDAMRIVQEEGFQPVLGRGDERTANAGQLLGCNVMAATAPVHLIGIDGKRLDPTSTPAAAAPSRQSDSSDDDPAAPAGAVVSLRPATPDAFIFVGSGDFHPLALALETDRPIIAADPYHGTVGTLEPQKHRILKQRYAAIGQAKTAQSFGIVVSTKGGQIRFQLAQKVLQKLRKHGKTGFIIQDKQISPQDLLYFRHLDAFVGVACPRVPIDDQGRYDKPFLTPQELDIVLGERRDDLYVFDTYSAKSK